MKEGVTCDEIEERSTISVELFIPELFEYEYGEEIIQMFNENLKLGKSDSLVGVRIKCIFTQTNGKAHEIYFSNTGIMAYEGLMYKTNKEFLNYVFEYIPEVCH